VRAFNVLNAIAASVNLLAWLGAAWVEWDFARAINAPDLPGNPNHVQVTYYGSFCFIMAGCAVGLFAVASYTRFRLQALLAQVLLFFVVFLLLLSSGGGM
jgi:hypothetical protein